METLTAKPAVKRYYYPTVRMDLTRHDAIALMKLLETGSPVSKSIATRLRRGIYPQLEAMFEHVMDCMYCKNTFVLLTKSENDRPAETICSDCANDEK